MSSKEKEYDVWNIQVPKLLNKALEEAITRDFHVTKAEYIREAVREKLLKAGITAENMGTLKGE